jgi:CBS domain-containing protein
MTREVRTCRPESSLNDAAHVMWVHDCGLVPVVNDQRKLVGVITDRDLAMGAYMQGKALRHMKVSESMSSKLFTCRALDPIEQAVRCMSDHQVRRVPVVDELGKLVGILSLNDVVRRLVGLTDERERARLTPRFVEALASIGEPPGAKVPEVIPAAPPEARKPVRI